MNRFVHRLAGGLLCGLLGCSAPFEQEFSAAFAQEFRVNATTAGDQALPAVAGAPDGRFVVAWEGPDDSLSGIWAQRFTATGVADGPEFRVNAYTRNRQTNPAVAMDGSGNFVVLWNSSSHTEAEGTGVFGQRYAADGTPRGGMFQVNHSGRDIFALVGVAMDEAGNFVVAWPERGDTGLPVAKNIVPSFIMAQRYDAAGVPQGAAIEVAHQLLVNLRVPAVGMDRRGGFVVAWNADVQSGFITETSSLGLGLGIFARRYAADGRALGAAFRADQPQRDVVVDRPAVAMSPEGEFAIAWQTNGADLAPLGVQLRRYGADGRALGPPQLLDAQQLQRKPALALNAAGELAVAAHRNGLFVCRYSADGTARGCIRADSGAADNAVLQPGVAMDALGALVVTWQTRNQDGDGRGVYARQLAAPPP